MIFRIIAKNKERTEAYAELLDHIELMADGRVFCVPIDGGCYFAARSEIMYNANIIHKSTDRIYKILLDGYGIPETKRAGRSDEE